MVHQDLVANMALQVLVEVEMVIHHNLALAVEAAVVEVTLVDLQELQAANMDHHHKIMGKCFSFIHYMLK